jgi:hypothetical protein
MKIKSIDLTRLQNAEHFQFCIEMNELIVKYTPTAIDIQTLYPAFEQAMADEDQSFKIVQKSALSKDIEQADKKRDTTFAGLRAQVKAQVKHFDADTAAAAYRLQVLFDAYGDVARKSLDQETADITNLVQDLNGKYKTEVETIGFVRWVEQLDTENKSFDTLMKQRFDEYADKSAITRLRTARGAADDAYRAIVARVNAGIVFNGEEKYRPFVLDLNVRIDRYNNTLAQRKGK